ncbi:caspase recruitment domain-containing protein 14 isoform X2 [Xyrauchen texanus]|nr:caspase recruitment domain-containing protein 14 isoform X2 [Xyrauchen texanus]
MQTELQEARHEVARLQTRCSELEGKLGQAQQNVEEYSQMHGELERLRSQLAGLHRDWLKQKDEKYDLYVRYTTAVEEKSVSSVRNRDLQLQVYQLQCELRKAQKETDFQKHCSLRNNSPGDSQQLQEEVNALHAKLIVLEKFSPACQDILSLDLKEARDRRSELAEEINRLREENEQLQQEKEELLEQKDCLTLDVEKLTVDCEMYQHKSALFQSQLGEVQAERDRAYLSRDEAQAHIARSLMEKDTMRGQLMELQEKVFTMNTYSRQREGREKSRDRMFSWESSRDLCSESPPCSPRARAQQHAHPPECYRLNDTSEFNEEGIGSVHSSQVEPPCSESLRRREFDFPFSNDSHKVLTDDSSCGKGWHNDFAFNHGDDDDDEEPKSSESLPCHSDRKSSPPFLMRSRHQALRISGRVISICVHGEKLLNQLQVIGGNKTGVFVYHVTEGSSAHTAGISPGTQILQLKYEREQRAVQMVLEDTTLEEALWALGQVQGLCHITLRPSQDAYENMVQQLKSGEVMSGDSFYVRVNMALAGDVSGNLAVKCNDILHVTNTHYGNDGSWWASQVHTCQLMDLKSGTLPNYYRAQRLLIRAIEVLTYPCRTHRKVERATAHEKQRAVRIVSTGQQNRNPLWVSVEEDNSTAQDSNGSVPRRCVTLMPYTLVTPHYPPVCRPVLLLPTILGQILHKRLAEQEGYQLCESELLIASEHAVRMQKGEILEECDSKTHRCYTTQGVDKIMKRGIHCVLPLGLDCVRRLHRAEIFPIIIFIISTERSVRRLRQKLRQNSVTESQLLECSSNEEPLLDKLPCLYRSILPESWHDSTTLVDNLKTAVTEEQNKIVWVESDLW